MKHNGGPAFPIDVTVQNPGMSLRDWFAGQALSAMQVKDDGSYSNEDRKRNYDENQAGWYAKAAYRIADAMLAVRSKE